MSAIDNIFNEYVTAFEHGIGTDPQPYLARLTTTDRPELESRIDDYLREAPRHSLPSQRQQKIDAVIDKLDGLAVIEGTSWSGLLPRLRINAGLNREEVSERLAEMLDARGAKQKIGRYYNDMEQGRLSAHGVSDNVLKALGQIVGESPKVLREAGLANDDVDDEFLATDDPPHWDEIDRMFLGGDRHGE